MDWRKKHAEVEKELKRAQQKLKEKSQEAESVKRDAEVGREARDKVQKVNM
jgi:hypothetical protein